MDSKICFKCTTKKPLSEFYKHSGMADGYLNKCKSCCKEAAILREHILRSNPDWIESERERSREKYHRLKYFEKYGSGNSETKKIWIKRNPEKRKAHNAVSHFEVPKGKHWHHWSYNEKDYKDVILLSISDHKKFHRFLKYDRESKYFTTNTGLLLDSKEKHIDYINLICHSF